MEAGTVKCLFCGMENPEPEMYDGMIHKCDCGAIYAVDDREELWQVKPDMVEYLTDDSMDLRVEFKEIANFDELTPPMINEEEIPEGMTDEEYFGPDNMSEQVLVWAKLIG